MEPKPLSTSGNNRAGAWAEHDTQPGLEVRPEPEAPQVVPGQVLPDDEPGPPPPSKEYYDPTIAQQQQYQYYQQQQQQAQAQAQAQAQQPHPYYQQTSPQQYSPQNYIVSPTTATTTSPPQHNVELASGINNHPPGQKRICGLPRRKFFLILVPLLLLVLIALGVGLGVGLSSSSSDSSSSSPSPAPTPLSCPAANGTLYTSSSLQDSYNVLCSIDYGSQGGSIDINSAIESNAEGCAAACDARSDCVGAGYGSTGGASTCYMKGKLGVSNTAIEGWVFLVRNESN